MIVGVGCTQGQIAASGETTLVGPPDEGYTRSVKDITIQHLDVEDVALRLGKRIGDDVYWFGTFVLEYDDTMERSRPIYLTATNQSVVAELIGFGGSTLPTWIATYGDAS
jgi:hypothetical protein